MVPDEQWLKRHFVIILSQFSLLIFVWLWKQQKNIFVVSKGRKSAEKKFYIRDLMIFFSTCFFVTMNYSVLLLFLSLPVFIVVRKFLTYMRAQTV